MKLCTNVDQRLIYKISEFGVDDPPETGGSRSSLNVLSECLKSIKWHRSAKQHHMRFVIDSMVRTCNRVPIIKSWTVNLFVDSDL